MGQKGGNSKNRRLREKEWEMKSTQRRLVKPLTCLLSKERLTIRMEWFGRESIGTMSSNSVEMARLVAEALAKYVRNPRDSVLQ